MSLSGSSLKAIAHPLRMRLLSILRHDGPSTATRLAERVGQSSGVTSYHLRRLAQYDFVREDETLGTGRERWWRAAEAMSPELPAARASADDAEATLRAVAIQDAERVDRWLHQLHMLPPEWEEAVDLRSYRLRLTHAQTIALVAQLQKVAESLPADHLGVDDPNGAECVYLQIQILPFPRSQGERADS